MYEQRPIRLAGDCTGDYEQWLKQISEIADDINGKEVTLELDAEPGFYYYGIASVSTKKENGVISTFEINIQADPFKCQNYQTVTVSQATSTKMAVQGDFETPCIIELTPINDTISFTIKGAARNPVTGQPEDITIKNLKQGKKVIIDGEACTVLQGVTNKFADADMWEFPSLLPGNNSLTFSSALCEVTIKYKPRYF
ncbi:MAG: DUF6558 family protein [Blautia sp.]|nr:DUF6558 family protein [Blautia sp.]